MCLLCTDIILYEVGFAGHEGQMHPEQISFSSNTIKNFRIAGGPSSTIIREVIEPR